MEFSVEVRNLTKKFDEFTAVDSINFFLYIVSHMLFNIKIKDSDNAIKK